MYKVYFDENLVYAGSIENLKIYDAKLELKLGKAGSFEFTFWTDNPCYNLYNKMLTIVTVYDNSEIRFRGRILNDEIDIYGKKAIQCEGELSFLLDSVIPPHTFNGSYSEYYTYIIQQHESMVESQKAFTVGYFNVGDFTPYSVEETEYKTAWDLLQEHFVSKTGGYLSTYTSGNNHYLDMNASNYSSGTSTQTVELGKNLVDIKITSSNENLCTAIIPLGAKPEGSEERLNIKSVNNNVDYVFNSVLANAYGRIYKTVIFDEITNASTLKATGQNYINNVSVESAIEITAADLSYLDDNTSNFNIGEMVNVYSNVHFGGVEQMLIKEITINLLNPAENRIHAGTIKKGIAEIVAENSGGGSSEIIEKTEVTEIVNNYYTENSFVVDSGTSGIWTWRTYSDGTAECFGKISITNEQCASAMGDWYRSAQIITDTTYAYPVEFTSAPSVQMLFTTYNSNGALVWPFHTSAANARDYLPSFYLIRPTAATGINGNINIMVRGNY